MSARIRDTCCRDLALLLGAIDQPEFGADEAGRVWTIRIEPRQDVSLWLTGDVCPYLGASPEAVLIEQGAR